MRTSLYVSLSGEAALHKRLETLASNIANMNTPGFRAEGITFNSVLSKVGERSTAYASTGTTYITRTLGAATRTDNPLDVAIQGNAWMAVKTPDGTGYTRDGRMQMTANGELQTINGYPVLDAGRAPMLLDPNRGGVTISNDGMISQAGRQVGAIGLFSIPEDATISRYDNSAVMTDGNPTAVLDFSRNGVAQGFIESSNVNPILEMTKLIEIQRSFDGLYNASQSSESSLQDAIKTLGSTS